MLGPTGFQNRILAPNCIIRAAEADVMVPKVELLFKPLAPGENETFGMPRFTWLVALIHSARICSETLSTGGCS